MTALPVARCMSLRQACTNNNKKIFVQRRIRDHGNAPQHGGWVWRDVLNRLRSLGHIATAPTLTGLGERQHLATSSVDLETHVEDVVAHIQMEDLRNVTLVGWSYGGMVVTGVQAGIPARIQELVYLDAFVPEDGRALIDYVPPELKAEWDVFKIRNLPLSPMPLSAFGVTDPALTAFVQPRITNQPWRTFYQPVTALKARAQIPTSYVVCTGFGPSPFISRLAEMEADPAVRTTAIDTSHHCMLTDLEATISVIAGV